MKKRYILPNISISQFSIESLCDVVISQGEPTDDFGSKQRDDSLEEMDNDKWEYGNLW